MKISFCRSRFNQLIFLCLLSLRAISHASDDAVPSGLQPGDLVGICGDSITEQKRYSVDIADYLLMCQPRPKLSVVQFGWGGERATGFLVRMKNDALVFKPTVATICYGMNDGGYAPTSPATLDKYRQSMTGVVDTLKANGVRFIVVGSPTMVDPHYFKGPVTADVYNRTLAGISQVAKEVAQQEGVGFADVHGAFLDAVAKAKAQNGDDFCVLGGDGVHPKPAGHIILAYAFLKALGCDGNIGTITVDMKANTADATDGNKVISYANGTLDLESTRYPFCFYGVDPKDPMATRSILPFLPFNQDLNRYMLVVKNAPAPSLKVTWGTESKTVSATDLANGINLAAEFPDNPFSTRFSAVEQNIAEQQAIETYSTKVLLHALLKQRQVATTPEAMAAVDQSATAIVAQWQPYRNASAASVMPVTHEIKIEAAP